MSSVIGVVKRVFTEAREDNITGEGAKVAYYLFLSLFPLILVVFSLTGILGGDAAFQWIMARIQAAAPPAMADYLAGFVRQITGQSRPDILSLGLLLTLWAASGGFAAFADGLNTMYDLRETRSWWKKRLTALGLLLASVVLLIGGTAAILAGPTIVRAVGLPALWNALRWPIAFALLVALLWMIYLLLPNRDQSGAKGKTLVGAVIGAGLWLIATAGFRYYIANFSSYSETYGFVGGVIVLMLWLYLTAVVTLLGGEVAAVLERPARGGRRKARRAA